MAKLDSGIEMTNRFKTRLRDFHKEQSGAIAMMTMAAMLILMMMAWVVYDAGFAARDALNVQAAADTAAFSQSSVEARSMNMIAFANVGKRVTFGITSYYLAVWAAYIELIALAAVLTIACWVANVFALGSLSSICTKLTEFTIETGIVMALEAPDLAIFEGDLVRNYYKEDMEAFSNYQTYMSALTPWWSWAESTMRGMRNGAAATASWPPPKKWGVSQTNKIDALPIRKMTNAVEAYAELCVRVYSEFDIIVHLADYSLKNFSPEPIGAGTAIDGEAFTWPRPVMFGITGPLAIVNMPIGCAAMGLQFGSKVVPWEMRNYSSSAAWMQVSSNLVFAYSPDSTAMSKTGDRKKYEYLSADYSSSVPLIYSGGGDFAVAKSEISFQDGAPDLWKTSWTARMRPVALPGEWSGLGNDVTLVKAWRDVLPQMVMAATIAGAADMTGGGASVADSLESGAADLVRMDAAMGGLSDSNIEGFHK